MLILRGPRKNLEITLEITRGPEDWKQFLAEPEKHWKDGRSAKMLAEAWEGAAPDVPQEMRAAFVGTPFVIEGKVDESFGPLLGEWLVAASPGKRERLAFLRSTLGVTQEVLPEIRYQLLHRTASPVVEAKRLGARYAAMIVHSFSAVDACLEDYQAFAAMLGVTGGKGGLERAVGRSGPELWVGWVSGAAGA